MLRFLNKLWRDQSGISSVEYALLLSFIAAGIIFAANELGEAVGGDINAAADCISGSSPSDCTGF